jgi:hypothetical protein
MTEELMKREQQQQIDGFAGYNDGVEGGPEQAQRSVIRGSIVKFTNFATWVTRDGAELSANLELVAVDILRVVQKWIDEQPVETVILEPGQKFPDLEKKNEGTPQNEWRKSEDGQLRGPWQAQHVVYLLNPETMDSTPFPPAPSADPSRCATWSIRSRGCAAIAGRTSIRWSCSLIAS